MTERVCGNCHFYGRPRKGINDDDIAALDEGDDLGIGDLRICGYVEHFNINLSNEKLPKNIPVVTDSSGYYAALRVPADYGCNKWQPKEAKPDGKVASQQHD